MVMPNTLAAWIRQLMVAVDFVPGVDPKTLAIGLKLRLREEVPEHVFLNLRFDLLVPVIDLDGIEDHRRRREIIQADRHYSKIHFAVDDVLGEPGSNPSYILRLVPLERDPKEAADAAKMQDNADCFEALMTEMAQTGHPHKKGLMLEWRNGFNRVRFYHAKHRASCDRAHFPNPRYVALVASRLRGLVGRLPTERGLPADPEADARELAALIDSADAAFSDPTPPAPGPQPRFRRESFGYDVYLVHGLDFGACEEFDLDQALVEARRDHEAA